jgi:pyruvate ferredoxin oxidoreductase beta subunit
LVRNQQGLQPLAGGHALCQGCGVPVVVRVVLSSLKTPAVVVNATGCLEVAATRYPTTAWNVPWLHVAFENAAPVASGVESAQRALRRRHGLAAGEEVAVVVFAGDGAPTTSVCRRSRGRSSAATASCSSVTTTRRI